MKSTRECQFRGNEGSQPTRICILDQCNQYTRWVCAECVVDGLHHHGQKTTDHIKRQQEFLIFIEDSIYYDKNKNQKTIQMPVKFNLRNNSKHTLVLNKTTSMILKD